LYQEENEERIVERIVRLEQYELCTAAVDSYATISVVGEIRSSTISERGARIDDKRSKQRWKKKTTRILLEKIINYEL
jgi:sulfate adenylyltransferase subunit 2